MIKLKRRAQIFISNPYLNLRNKFAFFVYSFFGCYAHAEVLHLFTLQFCKHITPSFQYMYLKGGVKRILKGPSSIAFSATPRMSESRTQTVYRSSTSVPAGTVGPGVFPMGPPAAVVMEREVAQLRQDLSAAHEIVSLARADSAALKIAVAHHKAAALKAAADRQQLVEGYEGRLREMMRGADEAKAERLRMAAEVSEAISERERQAAAIADVRRSVDARLTRLMEEIHRKDEELHKLQFAVSERDRDRERAAMLERMLASREENISQLLGQLTSVRGELSEATAELRHKALLVDQLTKASEQQQQQQALLTATPSRLGSHVDHSISGGASATPAEMAAAKEVLAILPLYRQWSGDLRADLELVDDGLDAVLDVAVDLRAALVEGRGGAGSVHQSDRQRLHRMRQLEKERMKQQANLMLSAAIHSDDPQGVHIHAIRAIADHSRYEMERVKETVTGLADCLEGLQRDALSGALLAAVMARAGPSAAAASSPANGEGGDDSVIIGYTQPASVAGAPLTPSVVRLSAAGAAAQAAEVTRLHAAIAAKDERAMQVQQEVFEWREKASAAESQVRILEREVARATADADAARNDAQRAAGECRGAKDAMAAAQQEHTKELESLRREHLQMSAAAAASSRDAEDRHRAAMADATERLHADLRDSRAEVSSLARATEEAAATEARLRAVLEESKQKRLEWKRAKEAAVEELGEARNLLTAQNRELRQAQEMVESLSAELAHVKDVLDFEVSQQERRALMGAMGGGVGDEVPSPGGGGHPSLFEQWKSGHREDVRSAQAATARQPRKIVVRRKM